MAILPSNIRLSSNGVVRLLRSNSGVGSLSNSSGELLSPSGMLPREISRLTVRRSSRAAFPRSKVVIRLLNKEDILRSKEATILLSNKDTPPSMGSLALPLSLVNLVTCPLRQLRHLESPSLHVRLF